MRKFLCYVIVAALAVSTGGVAAAEKVTVVLEDNVDQMRLSAGSLAYRGDPELRDAFRTLQARLQTMLVSSGRVDVKPKNAFNKARTQEKVYLCSYTLVQGSVKKFQTGKPECYIIGLNLQAWNYLTETALPELTRTVDLRVPATTPENAFAYVVRYLAFITLEELSPVTVLKRDGNDIYVNAGSELLKKGDVLQIRGEGFREHASARVIGTERMSAVAELTDGDLSLVKAGAVCRFVLPDVVAEAGLADAGPRNKVPTVKISEVKTTVDSATVKTYNVQTTQYRGRASKMYKAVPAEQTVDLSGLPDKLRLQLRTVGQGTGLKLLALNPSQEQEEAVDYALACVISGYSEWHTAGRTTDSGILAFQQKAALNVYFELKETKTGTVVVADTVKSVMQEPATGQRMDIADALIADSTMQIAAKIQNAVRNK
ncbi:MAG TPA: hypothetical protein PKM57_01625 [Kiritimatiellia bacterium]|nr:hypothetical protein [Kiritimatiellia bacterium]HPS09394.1 hypothetical protein [Kiritimatiellia bacterium]